MQQDNKTNYDYWAALPKWTASQFAFLLLDQEPLDSDYNEQRGFGPPNWGQEYNRILGAVILWLQNDLNMPYARECDEATPSQFIILAERYRIFPVPKKLKEGVENNQSSRSGSNMKSEQQCENWLRQITSNPKTKSKKEYEKEALVKFKGLSARGFDRAWGKATQQTAWNKAGAIPKKQRC